MWSRKKDKTPQPTPPATPQPRRHARTNPQPGRATAEALILPEPARSWLTHDVTRLEEAAHRNETEAERLLADAAEWRTVAAGYRRILDLAEATALRAEHARLEREAAALEQPPVPADPQQYAASWSVPEWGDEVFLPPRSSSWGSLGGSNDGLTAPMPLVNGEAL